MNIFKVVVTLMIKLCVLCKETFKVYWITLDSNHCCCKHLNGTLNVL